MTCPHCLSTEIIKVQNQFFCLACGQVLSAANAKATTEPKTKKGPGRPKASKLDTPRTVEPAQVIIKAPEKDVPMTAHRAPSGKNPIIAKSNPSVALLTVLSGSIFALDPLLILLALPGATSILLGLVVVSRIRLGITPPSLYFLFAGLLITGVLWLSLVRATTIVFRAGMHDHHPIALRVAWMVALKRGHKLLLWRLWFLVRVIVTIGVIIVGVTYGRFLSQYPSYVQLSAVFVTTFIALGLLAVSWVRHGLTEAALTLGDIDLPRARQTARVLSKRRFELIGIKIFGLMFWSAVPFAVYYTVTHSSSSKDVTTSLSLLTATILFTVIGYTLTSAGASGEMYRELVHSGLPDEVSVLYDEQRSARVSIARQLGVVTFVMLPTVLGISLFILLSFYHLTY